MTEIIVAVLSFVGGGGLISVFLIREKQKSAKIDNAEKIIGMYRDIADEWKKLVCYNLSCDMRTPKYECKHLESCEK